MYRPITEYRRLSRIKRIRKNERALGFDLLLWRNYPLIQGCDREYRFDDRSWRIEARYCTIQKRCAWVIRGGTYGIRFAIGKCLIVIFGKRCECEYCTGPHIHNDRCAAFEVHALRMCRKHRKELTLDICIDRERNVFSFLRWHNDIFADDVAKRICFDKPTAVFPLQPLVE